MMRRFVFAVFALTSTTPLGTPRTCNPDTQKSAAVFWRYLLEDSNWLACIRSMGFVDKFCSSPADIQLRLWRVLLFNGELWLPWRGPHKEGRREQEQADHMRRPSGTYRHFDRSLTRCRLE
jgi:hypothetical protein